ncbi:hypothetical protein [Actinoplanes sp. NPDC049265]|uniref:hypothetical protein n=1 Tax=Actinoplanes sp. NPDC049265 TaxID=3363902 RepID=UPI0037155CB3
MSTESTDRDRAADGAEQDCMPEARLPSLPPLGRGGPPLSVLKELVLGGPTRGEEALRHSDVPPPPADG